MQAVDDGDLAGDSVGAWNPLAVINGNPAIAYGYLSNSNLYYMRALDAQGTNWGTAEQVDNSVDVGYWVSMVELNSGPAIAYFDGFNNTLKFAAYH